MNIIIHILMGMFRVGVRDTQTKYYDCEKAKYYKKKKNKLHVWLHSIC